MPPSEDARTALLDAAERCFATTGIAQVSDRRVADAAGNTNHSAVRYYFGGREGLLSALIERHLHALEEPRRAMFGRSDSLLGDVRSLVLPTTSVLAGLPRPTSRARFLAQALHDPATAALMRQAAEHAPAATVIVGSVESRLSHLDRQVVAARVRLVVDMVSTACADVEARAEQQRQPPRWHAVGDLLADAIAGMLLAPISHTGDGTTEGGNPGRPEAGAIVEQVS